MSVTYQCKECGRWSTVRQGKVGATVACEDCGRPNVVPDVPDLFDADVDARFGPAARAAPGRAASPSPSPSMPVVVPRPTEGGGGDSSGSVWGGVLSVVGVVLLVFFKLAIRTPPRRPPVPAPAPPIQIRRQFLNPPQGPMPPRPAPNNPRVIIRKA